jgi:peptide/nickel transport system substrate-binding protein
MRTLVPAALPTQAPAAAPAAPTTAPAAPASTAAPAVTRAEPKGRLTTTFQTTLSPSWLDPQENPPQVTPYNFAYCLHDALVKHMPDKLFAPSLAESYEIPPDFKSATFKLRPGVKFHDGSPVTPEDVKFTYEQYRGASSTVLKAKLDRIETPDDRTVRFHFKEPFVDFLMLYGSPASGAGWIIRRPTTRRSARTASRTPRSGPAPSASSSRSPATRWSSRRCRTTGGRRPRSRRS